MPRKKIPIKGEPDFTHKSDTRIKECLDVVQDLLFIYQYCDSNKMSVLRAIWKDLAHEDTDRTADSVIKSIEEEEKVEKSRAKVRTIKRVKIKTAK